MELSYGNVYCYECGDYVYNNDLEDISEAAFDKLVKLLHIYVTPWPNLSYLNIGFMKSKHYDQLYNCSIGRAVV